MEAAKAQPRPRCGSFERFSRLCFSKFSPEPDGSGEDTQ